MNVLLDMNVVLDVLLKRPPWDADAAAVWDAHATGRLKAYVAAFSLPTIFYVVRRQNDLADAHEAVRVCLETFEVVSVGRSTLELARQQAPSDYEDALQIASAIEVGADAIVTRDPSGFMQSSVPAISPAELLKQIPNA
jgi:predicted nucleic acid-binding protein